MLFLLPFAWRWPKLVVFLFGVICFTTSWSWQYQQQQTALNALLAGAGSPILVEINSTPKNYPDYTQLSATVLQGPAAGFQIKLRWPQPPFLAAGQQWRLRLNITPLRGYANPGGFNTGAYALVNGLVAAGQVERGPHILVKHRLSLRQQLVARVEHVIEPFSTAPLLKALAVGERNFSKELWQGAQHSGLGHLLAISGLHIGLVFGWIIWLGGYSKGFVAIRRQQLLVLLLGLAAALLYAWLANFAIPTLRATVALAIIVICRSQLASISLSRFWLLLVAMLLLIQPFWTLSASFWLSVLAVATIFIVMWRYPIPRRHWRARLLWFLAFHLLLSLMMTLFGILFFGGFSPLMLLSNLVFVPWCSLVAIPLLLLSLLLTLTGFDANWLWQLTDLAFRPLLQWLQYSATLPLWWPVSQVSGLIVALLAAMLLVTLVFNRKVTLTMVPLCLILLSGSALQPRQWQLHLLDSGQRQLLLLQYGQRALLYDAAPPLATTDIADRQLLPVLRQLGIRQLDYILFRQQRTERSRQWTMLADYRVAADNLQRFSQRQGTDTCQQLPVSYQNIRFDVLTTGLTDSCMLRITLGQWRVLIPGIIDPATERVLLAGHTDLTADVLILANNGSAAVNSLALLQQVRPVLALNAAAFMNGYHHPAQDVRQRLSLLGVPLLNTAEYGAITVVFSDKNLQISSWRQQRLPFWAEKPTPIAETLTTTR